MIHVRLRGGAADVDVHLPAVPRMGEEVLVEERLYVVSRVVYRAASSPLTPLGWQTPKVLVLAREREGDPTVTKGWE